MNAPFCPISRGQKPVSKLPMRQQVIPIATDLTSLIRTVNIIREVLVNISTSRVVNNTYLPKKPRDPKILPNKTYVMSPYPTWYQKQKDVVDGFVYYKSKSGKDAEQRTYIERTNAVEFRNTEIDNDNPFIWRYRKPLDSEYGQKGPVFEEDFFERVVNVHWGKKELEYFVTGWSMIWMQGGGFGTIGVPCESPDGPLLWGALVSGASCTWGWKLFPLGKSKGAVFSGTPVGTGGGVGDCFLPNVYPGAPYHLPSPLGTPGIVWPVSTSSGPDATSHSVQVIAQTIGAFGCYGEPPSEGPSGEQVLHAIAGRAPSQYSGAHPGPMPGSDVYSARSYGLVGSTTITANITAKGADDGKPLKREDIRITFARADGETGGSSATVQVLFSRPKKKKKKT